MTPPVTVIIPTPEGTVFVTLSVVVQKAAGVLKRVVLTPSSLDLVDGTSGSVVIDAFDQYNDPIPFVASATSSAPAIATGTVAGNFLTVTGVAPGSTSLVVDVV